MSLESQQKPVEQINFATFLETIPPGQEAVVSNFTGDHPTSPASITLANPDVRLFCESAQCNGYRNFFTARHNLYMSAERTIELFVLYTCRNCRSKFKTYALRIMPADHLRTASVLKYGEHPAFGPPIPARVNTLIGPDRELFSKGRRSENQGLGIGAFGYYRRVVENQKARILDEVKKVSEKIGASPELIRELEAAKKEDRFSAAIESIKHAIPQVLLIDGHNPLTLLHSALSEGLHKHTDDECLALATSIRVVLTELAERMAQALKDEAELKQAVAHLLSKSREKAERKDKGPQ